MPLTLTSERLILRPVELADVDDLYDFYRRPDAMRFMDTPPHTSPEQTRKRVDAMCNGPGTTWTVRTDADGPALGFVDYVGNSGVPGMGYMLHPDHWGNGYMSEAVRTALDYGFDEMGLDRVELWIQEENSASLRLAERVGFRRRGRLRQKYGKDATGHEKIVYGITAEQWRTGQRCPAARRQFISWPPYWLCRMCRLRPSSIATNWALRSAFSTVIRPRTPASTAVNGHRKARIFSFPNLTKSCPIRRLSLSMSRSVRTLTDFSPATRLPA